MALGARDGSFSGSAKLGQGLAHQQGPPLLRLRRGNAYQHHVRSELPIGLPTDAPKGAQDLARLRPRPSAQAVANSTLSMFSRRARSPSTANAIAFAFAGGCARSRQLPSVFEQVFGPCSVPCPASGARPCPKSCPDSAERDGTPRNLMAVERQTLDAELPIFSAKQAIRVVSLRGFNSRRLHYNLLKLLIFY